MRYKLYMNALKFKGLFTPFVIAKSEKSAAKKLKCKEVYVFPWLKVCEVCEKYDNVD